MGRFDSRVLGFVVVASGFLGSAGSRFQLWAFSF